VQAYQFYIWRKHCKEADHIGILIDADAITPTQLINYAAQVDSLFFVSFEEHDFTVRFYEEDASSASAYMSVLSMIQFLLKRNYWQDRSTVHCNVNGDILQLELSKNKDFSWVDFFSKERQKVSRFVGLAALPPQFSAYDNYDKQHYLTEFIAAKPFVSDIMMPTIQPIEVADCMIPGNQLQLRLHYDADELNRSIMTVFVRRANDNHLDKYEALVELIKEETFDEA
jgi:hypothetical protein